MTRQGDLGKSLPAADFAVDLHPAFTAALAGQGGKSKIAYLKIVLDLWQVQQISAAE